MSPTSHVTALATGRRLTELLSDSQSGVVLHSKLHKHVNKPHQEQHQLHLTGL